MRTAGSIHDHIYGSKQPAHLCAGNCGTTLLNPRSERCPNCAYFETIRLARIAAKRRYHAKKERAQ